MEAKEETRKPTKEEKEEFKKIDNRLDNVLREDREQAKKGSKVEFKRKIFMKISDVDIGDAVKFKAFCDRHFDGKQFIGIKYMMALVDKLEPLSGGLQNQINLLSNTLFVLDKKILEHEERLIQLENPEKEEKSGIIIPKTQGGNKGDRK